MICENRGANRKIRMKGGSVNNKLHNSNSAKLGSAVLAVDHMMRFGKVATLWLNEAKGTSLKAMYIDWMTTSRDICNATVLSISLSLFSIQKDWNTIAQT